MKSKTMQYAASIVAILAVVVVIFALFSGAPQNHSLGTTPHNLLIQEQGEVELLPGYLERLSWGAVIAGTLISLMVMFILNLVGIATGLSQVEAEHPHDAPDAEHMVVGGIVWIGASNIAALMIGGGIAAYFSGIPEPVDGALHGIMVWAVSGIITILMVMSGVSRFASGLASLISSGVHLMGSAASGAGQVAGDALHTAGSAVGTAGNLSAQALSVMASGVQNSSQVIGNSLSNLSDTAIENSPDVQNALKYQDLSLDEIRLEAEKLIRQAGKDPENIKAEADAAVEDMKAAAEQAVKHPDHAGQILNIALQRVFRRGEEVASDVDRHALLNVLTTNTDMSREEAAQQIQTWEKEFNDIKSQTSQAREVARQKADEFRQQAEQKATEIYDQAQQKLEAMQQEAEAKLQQAAHEAEEKAREAAQATSETFAKVAAGIAIAMFVGAVAAGIGGYIGIPKDLPDIPVVETASTTTWDIPYIIHYSV